MSDQTPYPPKPEATSNRKFDLARSPFVIHARNAHDLRDAIVNDLARQIAQQETRQAHTEKASETAKIAYHIGEMRLMLDFWQRVNIIGGRKQ